MGGEERRIKWDKAIYRKEIEKSIGKGYGMGRIQRVVLAYQGRAK